MSRKYHPMTKKAINEYAHKFLSLYRASRSGGSAPKDARWQSRMALEIEMSYTKASQIIRSRTWKAEQI